MIPDLPPDILDVLKFLGAAFIGGWVSHFFQMRSARSQKAQDWRARKYEDAYLLVSAALEQPGMSDEEAFRRKKKLEEAINLVDLYGDRKIKAAARKIVDGYLGKTDWVVYDELRILLRDGFRKEMGLIRLEDQPLRIEFLQSEETAREERQEN